MSMNLNHVATILDESVTTLNAEFELGGKVYTFKVKKELAWELKRGDSVLVHTANGLRVVTVLEIHDESDIDTEARYAYAWAFQKVDLENLMALQEAEATMIAKLKSTQRESMRRQLRQQVLAEYGATLKAPTPEYSPGEPE